MELEQCGSSRDRDAVLCLEKTTLCGLTLSSARTMSFSHRSSSGASKLEGNTQGSLIVREESMTGGGLWWAPTPARAPTPDCRRVVAGYSPRGPGCLQGCSLEGGLL